MLFGLLAVFGAGEASADWQVWTLTQTKRVLSDEPAGNSNSIRIASARNEWESFQILMRSDAPLKVVDIRPGELKGPGDAVLSADNIRLYRQHQLQIDKGTYRNEDFRAPHKFRPGGYPDPLIPFEHPLTRKSLGKARFTAVPFDLPPEQTHGFWVDVFVPAEAKPGEYHGTYRVIAQEDRVVEIPVTLTVWDFTLPRVWTLQTALGSPADRMRGYYRQRDKEGKEKEPSDWAAIEEQCAELLACHRINATPSPGILDLEAQPDGTFSMSAEKVEALRQFVDRYHVNTLEVPHPSGVVKDPQGERNKLHAWLKGWDRVAAELNRPRVVFYMYLRDEPNTEEEYKYVQTWGRIIREAKSVVKVMVVEQPWTEPGEGGADSAWGDLYGAVDVWCPLFSLFRAEPAAQRQALGETIWAYTALCQGPPTPWWHIDYPLLNYRVPAWISWRYRIRGLLYWGGMSYWQQVNDPWTEPCTYGREYNPPLVFNGEGTLVYPARAVGYDGIVPSLRLKALRDSIEDYEYLAILERNGLAEKAQKLIMPLAGSWFDWETDPAVYEKARAKLAEMIIAASK